MVRRKRPQPGHLVMCTPCYEFGFHFIGAGEPGFVLFFFFMVYHIVYLFISCLIPEGITECTCEVQCPVRYSCLGHIFCMKAAE